MFQYDQIFGPFCTFTNCARWSRATIMAYTWLVIITTRSSANITKLAATGISAVILVIIAAVAYVFTKNNSNKGLGVQLQTFIFFDIISALEILYILLPLHISQCAWQVSPTLPGISFPPHIRWLSQGLLQSQPLISSHDPVSLHSVGT